MTQRKTPPPFKPMGKPLGRREAIAAEIVAAVRYRMEQHLPGEKTTKQDILSAAGKIMAVLKQDMARILKKKRQ